MPPAKGILSQGKTLDEIAALAQLGQRFIDLVHASGIEASRVMKKRRSPVKRAKKEGGNGLIADVPIQTVRAVAQTRALAKKRVASSRSKPAKRASRAKAKPIAVAVSSLEE